MHYQGDPQLLDYGTSLYQMTCKALYLSYNSSPNADKQCYQFPLLYAIILG